MPIESRLYPLPEEVEPGCPKCKQRCRRAHHDSNIYECPDCGLRFECVIQKLWDRENFSPIPPNGEGK